MPTIGELAETIINNASSPTVLIHNNTVKLVNTAARKLFGRDPPSGTLRIQDLPITVKAGDREVPKTLKGYLDNVVRSCREEGEEQHGDPGDRDNDDWPWQDKKSNQRQYFVAVAVHRWSGAQDVSHKRPLPTSLRAVMTVDCLLLDDSSCFTLTFSRDPETHSMSDAGSERIATARPTSRDSSRRYAHSASNVNSSKLDGRFSVFRDAIYYSSPQPGFILSADSTFAFPNLSNAKRVEPVEIDDLKEFLKDYDAWDVDFERKLTQDEYPSVWLNTHRENFKDRRIGLKQDGRRDVISASGQALFSPIDDSFIGGVVWVENLGEVEQFKAKQREENLKSFKTICDSLPHMVWTANAKGNRDYFSQSWYDFSGLSEQDSLNGGWIKAVHPDDMKLLQEEMEKGHSAQGAYSIESRYRRSDGIWRWVTCRGRPYLSDGEVLAWYGTSTDIHDLVEDRLAAQRVEHQILEVLAHSEVKLYEINADFQFKLLKGGFVFREHDADDGLGPDFLRKPQGPNHEPGEFEQSIRRVQMGDQSTALCEHQVNDRWFRTQLVADEQNTNDDTEKKVFSVLGCSIDLTKERERMQLEKENARLVIQEQTAVEQNKLKSSFLAHMSHELRTPVSGILGMCDFLLESDLSTSQKEYADCVSLSARNLLLIVNDILDLSKVETGRMEVENVEFRPSKVVDDLDRVWRLTCEKKDLRFVCSTSLPKSLKVVGDPHRIIQVLTNLLSNSSKFTQQGSITMSSVIEREDGDELMIKFSVVDTGHGIKKKVMDELFKPFSQGDSSTARLYGGTGLGLAISRNLANLMGGQVSLQSEPEKGTEATFIVKVRRAPAASLTSEKENEKTETASLQPSVVHLDSPELRRGKRILIVEDNPINLKIAVKNVQKLGFQVGSATNGRDAVEALKLSLSDADAEPFSSVLMDIQMPIMDGIQATKELRALGAGAGAGPLSAMKDLPIIALTASAISGDREKAIEAGMNSYLVKPLQADKLEEALVRWTLNHDAAGGTEEHA